MFRSYSIRKRLYPFAIIGWVISALSVSAPGAQTFNVKSYGATGNGSTVDSPAINAAIAAAGAAGGGMVTFPPGNYFCGSIHLTNNITLYLSNNAVIVASPTNIDLVESNPYAQYQDYGHDYFHDALIWGENLTNITFAGAGEITGDGHLTTGTPVAGQGDKALCLVFCTNVVITGITITDGGHFGILADACYNMLVTGANILEANARDGFNLIDSSVVVVTNCNVQGSDDAMVIKSDYALGEKIGGSNIHIVNCQITSTENNALQFGSETVGNFTDVSWANIGIDGAGKAGIGITSQDGSVIDGVTYDNISMTNCATPIFLKLDERLTGSPSPSVGAIRNISINNVVAYNSGLFGHTNTSTIDGFSPGVPIQNITFSNVNVSCPGGEPATAITNIPVQDTSDDNAYVPQDMGLRPSFGWYVRYAANISFVDCQAHFDNSDGRPAAITDTASNVLFEDFTADVGAANTNYDLGFLNTGGYDAVNAIASADSPSPGATLRVFGSNSIPASIVLPPYFSPGDGIYSSTQDVVIASGTPGSIVIYTTDGTTPSPTNGIALSGPVTVDSETVLRAMAAAPGMTNSAVNTAIFNFPGSSLVVPPPPPILFTNTFDFLAVNLSYITNGAPAAVQNDSNEPGGHWLALEATNAGAFIEYLIPPVPAGTYDLQMYWKGNNDRGIISFALDGAVLGSDLDQYSSNETYPIQDYGDVTFATTTSHEILLTAVGRNPASSAYWISAAEFVFSLVEPPQPVFGTPAFSGGALQVNAFGYPALTYQVQVTTNLASTNWTTLASVTAEANGLMNFSDTNASVQTARFYRLVTP